jgi:hypothetical protein
MYRTPMHTGTLRTLAAAVQDEITRLQQEKAPPQQIAALKAALAELERALAAETSGTPAGLGKQAYPFGPSEFK